GLAPERRLLSIIDTRLFKGCDRIEWVGTAEELRSDLTGPCYDNDEVRQLLNWSGSTGVYLGRLAAQHPERVIEKRKSTSREWSIRRPSDMPPEPREPVYARTGV